MNISLENPEKVSGVLTLVVEEADFAGDVEKQLKDYRKKANVPGFRPGQAPMGMIKRQVGAQVKVDVINRLVGEKLYDYVRENKINMLGEPMPHLGEEPVDLDAAAPYTLKFDIAIAPEFKDRLFILERSGKLGLGTAYIKGFKWALEHNYDYIFEMDADFSHDPNDVPRLYAACHDEGYDVAIGSRYVSGVNVVNWPIGRVLMSYFASKYVRFVTGFKVHDTTAGFKCYKRKVLETIELDKIRFKGYAFQIEMKFTRQSQSRL